MGGGAWTTTSYVSYSTSKGFATTDSGTRSASCTVDQLYTSHSLDPDLNPKGVIRECRDSEEHPNTIPVILALDVTGSMGDTLAKVSQKLNEIMTELYKEVEDVEFMIMGIGDLAYDVAPIQASQFESDIRIAEQLDKIYFERGGGGNGYESYTAAWYFGLRHTDLDCWKRGKKGIIITIGDEPLNPYLPKNNLSRATGDALQADIETKDLYEEVIKKFDIYHLAVDDDGDSYAYYRNEIANTFGRLLDKEHFFVVNLDNIIRRTVEIITNSNESVLKEETLSENTEISW